MHISRGLALFLASALLLELHITTGEDIFLKCDESDTSSGESFCTVSGFSVSHSQNVKIQSNSKSNATMFMKFYYSRLLYVPFKLFEVFANLKTLDVSFTEILDVPRYTFAAASNLIHLDMSNNNITTITTSVFMGAHQLISLNIASNQLTHVAVTAFHGLTSLDKISLSKNRLTSLENDIFLENAYISSIYLDHNLFETIKPEVFNRLRRIREVQLSYNRLVQIDPHTFQAAYGLEMLFLASNRLSEFRLDDSCVLTHLTLDYNNLTSISINFTKYVTAEHNNIRSLQIINSVVLESLVLRSNNISDIANITNITGLLHLDLSYNPIGPLNVSTFVRLKRLRTLQLRATGIRQLMFGMFSKQTYLETLDLSFNNLTELNLDIFVPYLSNLKYLYIDGNNLTEIQGKRTFAYAFQNLLKLGVSRNHFNCSYLHALLIPPQLSTSVTLHIEPDDSPVETTHIRDVSCISTANQPAQPASHELASITELRHSLDLVSMHAQRLQVYAVLLEIGLLMMVCLAIGLALLRMWKQRRTEYYGRRGSSIIFHSNATVNTTPDH